MISNHENGARFWLDLMGIKEMTMKALERFADYSK
jgi:hypothetical protein